MSSLYSLSEEMTQLMDWMNDPEADQQAIADTLEGLQYELENKAEAYCKVIRQFEADAAAYKAEEEAFKQKRTTCENNIKRMKDALMHAMAKTGHNDKNGLTAGLFKLKVVGNGGKKPLIIDGDVPEMYINMVPQIDTEAIRAHCESLAEGETCEFAHLADRGVHLSIK